MITAKAAHRYAEAIFPLAKEQNKLDEIMQDFELIHKVISSSADFRILIASPIIPLHTKKNIFFEIFKSKISSLTFDLLNLMLEKGRENIIIDVYYRFQVLYNIEKNILPVVIISANEIPVEVKQDIISRIEMISNKKVSPKYKINTSVIGGFVVQIGDWVYDASLLRRLERMRQSLAS